MRPQWPVDLIDGYERLRTHVISGSATQAHGWLLFIRDGMRAWSDACQAQPAMRQTPRSGTVPFTPAVPESVGEAAVQVLANMVLNLQQEVRYG